MESVPRRTIILSAFACSPLWGSEPGVGWHWAVQLSTRHDVVALTHGYFRQHIESHLAAMPAAERPRRLTFEYFTPAQFGLHPHRQLNSRLFYMWWQLCARSRVRALCARQRVDLIHHLTWGTFRFATFLGGLGVPLVMGPLGGGDVAPMRLYKGLPWSVRLREALRALSLRLSRFDPMVRRALGTADLILCKTDDTRRALPGRHASRALLACEIGAPEVDLQNRSGIDAEPALTGAGLRVRPFKLLFAGRLIGLKGVLLLLGTLKLLRDAGHAVQLQIAGDGPLHGVLARQTQQLGIADAVQFLGALQRQVLLRHYGQADLFVFPSLHDSSGNVVLEALSRGLPVVCLDLGGPKHYVTPDCGVVVSTQGLSRSKVEQGMARAITELILDPARLRRMSDEAARHARAQNWGACVARAYDAIEQRLAWSGAP